MAMAAFPKTGIRMFLLCIEVLPQKDGIDLPKTIQKLGTFLFDYASATRIVYKFKVSGESKILSVIQAANIVGLERTMAGLSRLSAISVECYPIVSFENFSRSIKVADHLTKGNSGSLSKDGLYWLQFDIEYNGKSTEELISVWRKEAEAILTARHKEGTSVELYKVVAQRKVHIFINAADPEQVDLLSLQLPLMQDNGANVHITCKAMQFLDDYCVRINSATETM